MKLHELSPPTGQQALAASASAAARAPGSARPPARARRARSRAPATAAVPASRAARCRSSGGCRSAASPTSSGPSTRWSTSPQLGGARQAEIDARSCWPSAAWSARGKPVKVLGDGEIKAALQRHGRTSSASRRASKIEAAGGTLRGARFVIESFRNIFAIPDLRKRLLFTFGLLAVYRIGCHIPTPGVDPQALLEFMDVAAEHLPRLRQHLHRRQPRSGSRCSRWASCRTSRRRSSCSC